jgi:hypothetical protein
MQNVLRFLSLALFVAYLFLAPIADSTAANNRAAGGDRASNHSAADRLSDEVRNPVRTAALMPGIEFLQRVDRGMVKEFEKAWQLAGNGTWGREAVVLVFRLEGGHYLGRSQGVTNEFKQFTFTWDPAAVAIVHTHPINCDPRPSHQDERVAEKFAVPIFTLSYGGMYVYNPTTRMTSKVVNGLNWLKLSTWQEIEAKVKRAIGERAEPLP